MSYLHGLLSYISICDTKFPPSQESVNYCQAQLQLQLQLQLELRLALLSKSPTTHQTKKVFLAVLDHKNWALHDWTQLNLNPILNLNLNLN